jgi:enoyl-CoA hydratase/carnithine racemase
MNAPVFVSKQPGCRVFTMSHPLLGNRLNTAVTFTLQDWVERLQNNSAVKVLIFQSGSFDMFSVGLNGEESVEEVESLHSLGGAIAESKTPTVAVYAGELNGTAYAAFAGCTYKLGTPSFHFRIDEILEHNKMPKGGLAYYFNKASPDGAAMARYLAISGHNVSGEEMYSMGLLSHLVEEDPQSSLTNAIAHTLPDRGAGEFKSPVRGDTISELLEDMNMDCDLDVFKSELWDRYLLVPPNRWDVKEKEVTVPLDEKDMQDLDLYDVSAWVVQCFGGSDRVEDSLTKLTAMAEGTGMAAQWAAGCLQAIKSADQGVVEAWWGITSGEVASSLEGVLAQERRA